MLCKKLEGVHYAYIETTIIKKERNFMKNFIKIVTIFGITIFASPVNSMMSEDELYYSLRVSELKLVHPPRMDKLPIRRTSREECSSILTDDHPFRFAEGLAIQLNVISFLEKSITCEKIILQTIYNAVSEGVSETSMYNIEPVSGSLTTFTSSPYAQFENCIKISSSQTPISVFELIKNWSTGKQFIGENKKNNLIVTILKGKLDRRKKLSRALTAYTNDECKIKVSQDIIDLILLQLSECNVDEKKQCSSKLIKQAKQEFGEE